LSIAIIAVAVLLGCGGFAIQLVRVQRANLTADDFTPDYVSARAWIHGADPYAPLNALTDPHGGETTPYYHSSSPTQTNSHPPFTLAIFGAFAWLPYRTARTLWLFLSAALIAVSTGAVARRLGVSTAGSLAIAIGSLALPVVQSELHWGQENAVLLGLLVLAWLQLSSHERIGGVVLGAAIALKLFPTLFLLPLVRTRRFRTAGWSAGAAVTLTAVGIALVGLQSTHIFVRELGADVTYWRANVVNHSLVGHVFRYLTPNPWMHIRFNHLDQPLIAKAVVLGLAIICSMAVLRTAASRSGDYFWAATPWILLITPLTWTPSFVLVLPLVISISVRSLRSGQGGKGIVAVAAWLVSAFPDFYFGGGPALWFWLFLFALPTLSLIIVAILDFRKADHTDGQFGMETSPPQGAQPALS
jgi:hypothetical protein